MSTNPLLVIKTNAKLCSTLKCFHLKILQVLLQWTCYLEVFPFHSPYKFIDCVSNSCLKEGTGLTLVVSGNDSLQHQLRQRWRLGLFVWGLPEVLPTNNAVSDSCCAFFYGLANSWKIKLNSDQNIEQVWVTVQSVGWTRSVGGC